MDFRASDPKAAGKAGKEIVASRVTLTFTVDSIEYNERATTIDLVSGSVGGADHMGDSGMLVIVGHAPIPLTPGNIIRVTIEDTGKRRGGKL